jgi:hypothetical protein
MHGCLMLVVNGPVHGFPRGVEGVRSAMPLMIAHGRRENKIGSSIIYLSP